MSAHRVGVCVRVCFMRVITLVLHEVNTTVSHELQDLGDKERKELDIRNTKEILETNQNHKFILNDSDIKTLKEKPHRLFSDVKPARSARFENICRTHIVGYYVVETSLIYQIFTKS